MVYCLVSWFSVVSLCTFPSLFIRSNNEKKNRLLMITTKQYNFSVACRRVPFPELLICRHPHVRAVMFKVLYTTSSTFWALYDVPYKVMASLNPTMPVTSTHSIFLFYFLHLESVNIIYQLSLLPLSEEEGGLPNRYDGDDCRNCWKTPLKITNMGVALANFTL